MVISAQWQGLKELLNDMSDLSLRFDDVAPNWAPSSQVGRGHQESYTVTVCGDQKASGGS